MEAIIYTSNTGSTARYAELLAKEMNLPALTLKQAKNQISASAEVIYLGWIMASVIKGYKAAAKKYKICAVCAVGMAKSNTQTNEIRSRNSVPSDIPLFTLQGSFNIKNLHGIYKAMMSIMVKAVGEKLSQKTDRTPEENDMLDIMLNGGDRVDVQNLKPVFVWYNGKNKNRGNLL